MLGKEVGLYLVLILIRIGVINLLTKGLVFDV